MSHQTRREYFLSIHGRYRRADQKLKQVILNEFCANTGYNRKYAIRLLNGSPPSRVRRCQQGPRSPSYGRGVISVPAVIWEAAPVRPHQAWQEGISSLRAMGPARNVL